MLGGEAGRGTVKMTVEKQCVIFREVEKVEVPFVIEGFINSKKVFEEVREKTLQANMRRGHSFITERKWYDNNVLYEFGEDIKKKLLTYAPDGYYSWELIARTAFEKMPNAKVRYIIFEEGGGYTNTGHATIVAAADGTALKPLFIRTRGHLACGEHAAFAIWEGQKAVVVEASHHRHDFTIELWELTATKEELKKELIWSAEDFDDIEEVLPEKFSKYLPAINAAMEKATDYHCRSPYFIWEGGEE